MPIQIEYLDNGSGALFRGTGVVTGEDITTANMEMFSTPEKTRKYKYGLADWTGVTEYKVTPSELQGAATQDKNAAEYLPELFIAIVADKDLEYGFSRMFSVFIEANDLNWELMLFRNMADAKTWIKEKVKAKYDIDVTVDLKQATETVSP
jgi:hypothetical protein